MRHQVILADVVSCVTSGLQGCSWPSFCHCIMVLPHHGVTLLCLLGKRQMFLSDAQKARSDCAVWKCLGYGCPAWTC